MDDFFIDKHGNEGGPVEEKGDDDLCMWSENDDEEKSEKTNREPNLFDEFIDTWKESQTKMKNKMNKEPDFEFEDTYITTNYTESKNKKKETFFSNVDEVLKKSILKPGLEKLHSLPRIRSQRALKKEKQAEREKTKGRNWFDIPATEMTDEIKTDMEVLKMRSVLDSKHVYKKNNFTKVPKYFQVGTVVEGPADFYNGRIAKSQRKKTIVDELLADAECKSFQRKKFKEIVNMKTKRKHSKHKSSKGNKTVKKGKMKK